MDGVSEVAPAVSEYSSFLSNLRELVDEGFTVNFVGGEVLLFDGFFELVKFSSQKGFLTSITSNGWLIDEKMAQRIASSGLSEINLSLDSLNEVTHDYLRGIHGVYSRVMKAIKYLNTHCKDTSVRICSAIYDWNLGELPALMEWAVNNDALSSISFLAPKQPSNTDVETQWWKGAYSYLWPKDPDKASFFIDKVLKCKDSYGHKIGNTAAQLETFKLYLRAPEKFVKQGNCNLGRAVHVNAAGDISLCFRSDVIGNIRNGDDIRDLWHSEKAENARKKIAACGENNCHFLLNFFFEGKYPFGVG
jgi:MoaA/NifB/PqqE/SkfB family radical SAM enzyme